MIEEINQLIALCGRESGLEAAFGKRLRDMKAALESARDNPDALLMLEIDAAMLIGDVNMYDLSEPQPAQSPHAASLEKVADAADFNLDLDFDFDFDAEAFAAELDASLAALESKLPDAVKRPPEQDDGLAALEASLADLNATIADAEAMTIAPTVEDDGLDAEFDRMQAALSGLNEMAANGDDSGGDNSGIDDDWPSSISLDDWDDSGGGDAAQEDDWPPKTPLGDGFDWDEDDEEGDEDDEDGEDAGDSDDDDPDDDPEEDDEDDEEPDPRDLMYRNLLEAIELLRTTEAEAPPAVPRDGVGALLTEAQALADGYSGVVTDAQLLMFREDAGDMIVRLRYKVGGLVKGNYLVLRQHYLERLKAVLDEARRNQVTLPDTPVDEFRAELDDFRKLTFVIQIPVQVLEQRFYDVTEALHYALQGKATDAAKLPIPPDRLSVHDAVLPPDQVVELLGRIKPGSLRSLGPGPMGLATENFSFKDYPAVEVEEDGGSFTLKRVPIPKNSKKHDCTVMPIGDFTLGKITSVRGDEVDVESGNGKDFFSYTVPGAKEGWMGRLLKRGVTPETYREVTIRELEHLVDFEYAFQKGPVALAQAINRVAGTAFPSHEAAIKGLIGELQSKKLDAMIPSDPFDPGAWTERMSRVLLHMSGESIQRDKQKTHTPSGNAVDDSGGDVVIHPIFKAKSLDTKAIIKLDGLGSVYSGGS